MRLIFILVLIVTPVIQCQENNVPENQLNVILQFIDEEIFQKKDYRIYVPPPPPEVRDSTYYPGKMRSDTVIKSLKPLKVYINDSIWFNPNFKSRRLLLKGFNFVNDTSPSSRPSLVLDIGTVPKRRGIILQSISYGEFKRNLPFIRYQNDYGGLISFHNLYFSKDGKKAYFEIHFFKGRFNATTNAVYAEWKEGKWKYTKETLSVS